MPHRAGRAEDVALDDLILSLRYSNIHHGVYTDVNFFHDHSRAAVTIRLRSRRSTHPPQLLHQRFWRSLTFSLDRVLQHLGRDLIGAESAWFPCFHPYATTDVSLTNAPSSDCPPHSMSFFAAVPNGPSW